MKRVLLSAGIIISLSAAAQESNLVENYFNRQLKAKFKTEEAAPPHMGAVDCTTGKIIHTEIDARPGVSLNGEKIAILPQDGMACLQPDPGQFNMPNAGAGMKIRDSGPGVIPNPGYNLLTILPRGKTTLMKKP